MTPAELAGILAREIDVGINTALTAVDIPSNIHVTSVVARVGSVVDADDSAENNRDWEAQFVLDIPASAPTHESFARQLPLPTILAKLPTRALIGVGDVWQKILSQYGMDNIGEITSLDMIQTESYLQRLGTHFAIIYGRARNIPSGWQNLSENNVEDPRNLLEILNQGPEPTYGHNSATAMHLWQLCIETSACLDHGVLATLPITELMQT